MTRRRLTATWRGMRAEVLRGRYVRGRAWVRLWLVDEALAVWAPMAECI